MPALLTRMSISTPAASKCSNAAMTAPSSATSKGRVSILWPASAKDLAAFASFCSSRPLRMSLAPAAARPRAIASPSPSDDPVTSAVLPVRSNKLDRSMVPPRAVTSGGQIDPHGRMIGGLVASAHLLIDRNRLQLVRGLRRQEQMVDADTVVLLPGARLIVPEGIEACGVRRRAQGVEQAERDELAEFEPRLRQVQSVVDPVFRARRVAPVGNDIEIACQHQRLLVFKDLAGVDNEPLQEGELVRVFLCADRIAVRQIDRRHPHDPVYGRDDRLDIARLRIVLIAGEASRHL